MGDIKRSSPLSILPKPSFGHFWNGAGGNEETVADVVLGNVVRDQPEARGKRPGVAAGAWSWELPDRVGLAAQTSASNGAARARGSGKPCRGR